jgi:hypothetical protein
MVTLATSDGDVWTEIAERPSHGRSVRAGPLRADPGSLDVDLGPGLSLRFARPRLWQGPFGPLGIAQCVPWLGQYWAPWLLGARVTGTFGDRSLDGAHAYAEKNWGAAFAGHWWWGQAECVAFAGGRIHGVAPTAVAVWTDEGIVSLAPPLARTVARAGGGEWHIRAHSARWRVEVRGEASRPLRLPVPLPRERRLEPRSNHYLLGRIELTVHRGRRLQFRGESSTAALEDGGA